MDLDDVGMAKLGDGLGLDPEPGEVLGAGLAAAADHLHGDEAVQAHLAGQVDDAHAPLAQLLQELVAGDRWATRTGSARRSRPVRCQADHHSGWWSAPDRAMRHRPHTGIRAGDRLRACRPNRSGLPVVDRSARIDGERRVGENADGVDASLGGLAVSAPELSPRAGGQSLKLVLARPTRLDVGHDLRRRDPGRSLRPGNGAVPQGWDRHSAVMIAYPGFIEARRGCRHVLTYQGY